MRRYLPFLWLALAVAAGVAIAPFFWWILAIALGWCAISVVYVLALRAVRPWWDRLCAWF